MLDPFGRSALPPAFDRAGRVRLVKLAADAMLAGEPVPQAAALFLGGAISAWLQHGGSLEKDFLKVRAPRGCHHTAQQLAALMDEEGTD